MSAASYTKTLTELKKLETKNTFICSRNFVVVVVVVAVVVLFCFCWAVYHPALSLLVLFSPLG